jgi:hypothetical protein
MMTNVGEAKILETIRQELSELGVKSELEGGLFIVHDNEAGVAAKLLNGRGIQFERKLCREGCPVCKGENPIVRVAGFSAYFTDMAKEVQDQIIARTQQRL